jgi:hypothetical protein
MLVTSNTNRRKTEKGMVIEIFPVQTLKDIL